jgi:hypothetical protein
VKLEYNFDGSSPSSLVIDEKGNSLKAERTIFVADLQ